MVITLVALLGLLQSVNIATDQNLISQTRDEALQIAEEKMNRLRIVPFDQISTAQPYAPLSVKSRLRGIDKSYTVQRTASAISASSRLMEVTVSWTYKNKLTSVGLQSVRTQ